MQESVIYRFIQEEAEVRKQRYKLLLIFCAKE